MGNIKGELELIAELSHQINSPLAAIRNALYLASCRSDDPAVLHYLAMADEEIGSITSVLRDARAMLETLTDEAGRLSAVPSRHIHRAAA